MWEAQDIFSSIFSHASLQPALFSFQLRPTWTASSHFSWWTSLSLPWLSCSTSIRLWAISDSFWPRSTAPCMSTSYGLHRAVPMDLNQTWQLCMVGCTRFATPALRVLIMCNTTYRYMVNTLGQPNDRTMAEGCTWCLWRCFSRSTMGLGGTWRRWSLLISGNILHGQSVYR